MSINLSQVSDELYREVDDAENTSISKIAFWLRAKVGSLNSLISTNFEVDETSLEYSPELTPDEAAILKEMYWIYYYDLRFKESIGAAGYTIVEAKEGDSTVRRTARTEFGKLYLQSKKDHQETLKDLVFKYRHNRITAYSINTYPDVCPAE